MIYVTLSNSKGEGPRSTTVEQLTSPDLPGGPQIIEIDQKKVFFSPTFYFSYFHGFHEKY